MWSPHKVKLAVSGCPRNCAEAGIKDVGIIGVDSGFEMYIGGNGGIKTEVAEFFVKVKTAEEVREYNAAFLQLYREEAFYLERTAVSYTHLDVYKRQRFGYDLRVTPSGRLGVSVASSDGDEGAVYRQLSSRWNTQYLYFKAGAYIQDNYGPDKEGGRVTFYHLNSTHR